MVLDLRTIAFFFPTCPEQTKTVSVKPDLMTDFGVPLQHKTVTDYDSEKSK